MYAGIAAAITDDGQAGLAVFLVPYCAIPLTALCGLARWIAKIRADRRETVSGS